MLLRLSIVNYALISKLDIEFGEKFSVITGETGAGKSIILGAIALMLGQRADNLTLPDASSKCQIEGSFDISALELDSFFEDNDLDYENPCIIRREITPQGKSRAFINDTPVNLNQLKELTSRLIDVHSQHQTLLLQDSSFQLSVVDSVAGNSSSLGHYRNLYKEISRLRKTHEELISQDTRARSELDYFNFLFEELERVTLREGEQEQLESEAEVQSHAEEIKTRLFQVSELLGNSDDNVLRRLNEAANHLNAVSRFQKQTEEMSRRIQECIIELRDISTAIEKQGDAISYSPERLSEINERLGLLYQLEQKHHVNSVGELILIRDELEQKIGRVDSLGQEVAALEKLLDEKQNELDMLAENLSEGRKAAAPLIEKALTGTVASLGMKDATFRVDISPLGEPGRDGADRVVFMFSANKGVTPAELSRIASGGELSRLMLAVKSLISSRKLLPTILFDEIDTGISGDTATRVGNILKKISDTMQVIAITHLPQIAGKSNEHFKVYKYTDAERTYSAIEKLNPEQRIAEIALMISGDPVSSAARKTAEELLQNNIKA